MASCEICTWLRPLVLAMYISAQGWLILNTHKAVRVMREEWSEIFSLHRGTVIVAHGEEFMGPIIVIVPLNCTTMRKWHRKVDLHTTTMEPHVNFLTMELVSGGEAVQMTNFTASSQPFRTSGEVSDPPMHHGLSMHEYLRRKINPPVKVSVCGKDQFFEAPRLWNRYFSMITLSRTFGWVPPTSDELKERRLHLCDFVIYWIIACTALKYGVKWGDLLTAVCGKTYVQRWSMYRTIADRFLESFLLHCMSIIYTLSLQIALCTSFLTFWREDHFVLNYMPMIGFTLCFYSLCSLTVFIILDRIFGILASSDVWIYAFWTAYTAWFVFVAVPMIAYAGYTLHFNFTVHSRRWFGSEICFSDEFVEASASASNASYAFIVVAAIDVTVLILSEFDNLIRPTEHAYAGVPSDIPDPVTKKRRRLSRLSREIY